MNKKLQEIINKIEEERHDCSANCNSEDDVPNCSLETGFPECDCGAIDRNKSFNIAIKIIKEYLKK